MDPSVAHVQVQGVRRAIAANVKLIADKAIDLHDAFIHPSFSLDLASVLEDVVGDSVMLHAHHGRTHKFVATDTDFLTKQARRMPTAAEDNTELRRADADGARLASTSDAFILDVLEDITAVLGDNASVASKHHVAPDDLAMCKPALSLLLCQSLSRAVHSRIAQQSETARLRRACVAANEKINAITQEKVKLAGMVASIQETVVELEQAVRELQGEVERSKADEAAQERVVVLEGSLSVLQARVVVLEESLSALQEENVRLRMDAKNEEAVAQGLVRKLEGELCTVHTAHLGCDMKLQGRDVELVQLREECKKLIAMHQEQLTVAAETARQLAIKCEEKLHVELERSKLAAELAAMKDSQKSFSIFKAQEYERMTAEAVRLHQSLNKGSIKVDDSLVKENMQLKESVQTLQGELDEADSKFWGALESCRTWKTTLDDVMARNIVDMEKIRKAAATEREIDKGELLNATHKIAELEAQLRERVAEISTLRETLASKRNRKGLNLAFDGTLSSPNRNQEMAVMPQVSVAVPALADATRVFTRKSLASIIGGYILNIVGRCTTNGTEFARSHGIREYLCPNTEQHAFLPAGPGKHGYLQIGFGQDSTLFEKGEYRHVFVGTGKFYVYYGFYHVLRVEPLTQHEWASLPIQLKMVYSDLTAQKDKSGAPTTIQQVLAGYESGALRAPCVRLQCVAFDTKLHEELIRANKDLLGEPAERSSGGDGRRKRQRVAPANESGSDNSSEDDIALAVLAGAKGRKTTNPRRWMRCVSSSPLSPLSGEE